MNKNKRGIALIISFMVIVVLTILGTAIISRSISESRIAQRYKESTQAFWLAEAGVNRALDELRNDYNTTGTNLWQTSLGQGSYSVDVEIKGTGRRVTAHGFVPAAPSSRVERIVEAIMSKNIPPHFYDNAIYSAGEVDLNGNAYSVNGDIYYADEIDNTTNVDGTITHDPSISPLARLSFEQLLSISQSQGNVYDEARLQNVQSRRDSFPCSFWYDANTSMPHVVYVETDLELNGDIGPTCDDNTIGGFYVVVGDVITNPGGTYDASINGKGQIDGVIYTRGEFEVNGGGGGLNINGGVWAGEEAELNGNATVGYNSEFMEAIRNLGIDAEVQIISWRDKQNPYTVTPQ